MTTVYTSRPLTNQTQTTNTDYTSLINNIIAGKEKLPAGSIAQNGTTATNKYTQWIEQQAAKQGYDSTYRSIYSGLLKASESEDTNPFKYQSYSSDTETSTHIDNLEDFQKWMYGTYGFDVDKSNWATLAKQYNYNKAREQEGVFTIEFQDPTYDPGQHTALENEYYQYITNEIGKKTDPRMAQYYFPDWLNEQYGEYTENTTKEKAKLYGVTYKEGMSLPQYDYDFESAGYTYDTSDADDMRRKELGLPPQSFLDLYEDTDLILEGKEPETFTATKTFLADYEEFIGKVNRYVQRKFEAGETVTEEAIQRIFDRYESFQDTENIQQSVLDQIGFDENFVYNLVSRAQRNADRYYQETEQANVEEERNFWGKVEDWMMSNVANMKTNLASESYWEDRASQATESAKTQWETEKRNAYKVRAQAQYIVGELQKTPNYNTAIQSANEVQSLSSSFSGMGADNRSDIMAIVNNEDVFKQVGAEELFGNTTSVSSKYGYVSEDEANVLRYYYGNGDYANFDNFLELISDDLDRRAYEATYNALEDYVQEEGPAGEIASATLSIYASAMAPATWLYVAGNALNPSADMNQYYGPIMIGKLSGDTRQLAISTTESPLVQLIESTGLSIIDMATKLPAGPIVSLAWMATSAAGMATTEALDRGATPTQAAAYGTLVGAVEYITEKMPLDNLFGMSDEIAKKIASGSFSKSKYVIAITEVLKQSGIEAREEYAAEILDNIVDSIVMGDKSEINQYIAQLVASGMSLEEAQAKAGYEFWIKRPFSSALGGALSGGFFGTIFSSAALPSIDQIETETQSQTQPTQEAAQAPTIDSGDDVGTNTHTAQSDVTQAENDTGDISNSNKPYPNNASAKQAGEIQKTIALLETSIEEGTSALERAKDSAEVDAISNRIAQRKSELESAMAELEDIQKLSDGKIQSSTEIQDDTKYDSSITAAVQSVKTNAQKSGNPENAKTLHQIVKSVDDWIGPISTRIFSRPKGAKVTQQVQGWYQAASDVIGMRENYAMSTLFHEIGHKLDNQYGLRGPESKSLIQNYLTSRIKNNYTKKQYAEEMIADFFRDYFLDPSVAEKNAKKFYDFVDSKLSKADGETVVKLRQMMADYLAQSLPEKIASHVVDYKNRDSRTFAERLKEFGIETEIKLFDEDLAISKFSKAVALLGDNDVAKNPSLWATRFRYSGSIAAGITTDAAVGPMTKTGNAGKEFASVPFASLFEFLKTPSDRKLYTSYLVAQHAIERDDQQKSALPGIVATRADLDDFVSKVETNHPEFIQHAQELHDWWYAFMQSWMVDTGMLDQNVLDKWKALNPNYVPFYRQLQQRAYGKLTPNGFSDILAPVKKAKKNDLPILNPIESMTRDILKYVSAVNARNVMLAVGRAVDAHRADLNDWLVEVQPKTLADKQRLSEIKKMLKTAVMSKYGESDVDAATFIETILPGEYLTTFRKMKMSDGTEAGVLSVKDDNGNERFYMTDNPMFFDAMTNLAPEQMAGWLKGLSKVMRGFKGMITYKNPIFAAANLLRDTGEGIIWGSQNNPGEFAYDLGVSIVDVIRGTWVQSDEMKKYRQIGGGGDFGLYTDSGISKAINKNVMPFKALGKSQKAGRIINVPTDMIESFNNALEMINRYAEFERSKRHGLSDLEAFNNSLEITLNFRRKGKWAKGLDAFIPFYNAMMQDLYKTIRAVKNIDTAPGRRQLGKVLLRLLWSQAAIGILEALLHKDDKDYEDLPRNLKDKYWILWKNSSGTFVKVPKPASIFPRFFAGVGRRATEYIQGDADAFEGFGQSMLSEVWPTTILDPFIAIGQNKTWYGSSIENYGDQAKQTWSRYDENTSEIAKGISNLLDWFKLPLPGFSDGLSPKELQYLIDQYTGVVGDLVLPATTTDAEGSSLAKMLGSRFTVDPVLSNRQMSDFYDLSGLIEETVSTIEENGVAKGITVTPEKFTKDYAKEKSAKELIKQGDKLIKEYKKAVAALDEKGYSTETHAREARELRDELNDELRKINEKLREFKNDYMK